MNKNTIASNKIDSSKSNNNPSISPSLLNITFGRDVEAGSGSVIRVSTHVEQPNEAAIGARNLQSDIPHNYEDDGPPPLKPIGATTKPTGNTHIKERDYDDDGPLPLKPIEGNTHIKERDYEDDGPPPLKPIGATTKPTGNTHIKERDYDDDGPPPLKPMRVTTHTGQATPINQPGQQQTLEGKSSVQDLDSGSGNKKAKSDEKTRHLEEPLMPIEQQEKCCGSCVIL